MPALSVPHWNRSPASKKRYTECAYHFKDDSRAAATISIKNRLPYAQQPIDYHGTASEDEAARLAARIDAEDLPIAFHESQGYLPALLSQLDVPVASQLLVFSKTALHPGLVSPMNPRAVYFNDNVSVTWTPGSSTLEMAADDPAKGSSFYVVHQDADRAPQPVRTSRCLTCHVSSSTLQVPGWMLRSFSTDEDGQPLRGYGHITHATDIEKRFGGWFVTGTRARFRHLGNRFGEQTKDAGADHVNGLPPDLDLSHYPSSHSDVVAHLVFNHQAHGKNLLTRVAYEARLNRQSDAQERLVRYLLFANEASLPVPMKGASEYADWFQRQGPFDRQRRSLREFDLETRLFRYRLSYLIYSNVFEGLPDNVKQELYGRLWEILSGEDTSPEFQHLEHEERAAIIEIVRDTKDDLPVQWAAPR